MIITDLSYQEIAADANDLDGAAGTPFPAISFNGTSFGGQAVNVGSGSISGPGGSVAGSSGSLTTISTK
ncbi:MAG: hypothetical protein C4287_04750, partial [Leptolyngbya sp. ERB_1_2]